MFKIKQNYDISDLREIMKLLRSENGCPWDREQTHASIRMNVIEEAYEVAEAIDSGDADLLKEELGDLLLQVVFHAEISAENPEAGGGFGFDEVCDGICKKLVYRHPHVFGNVKADTPDEVLKNWDELKKAAKGNADGLDSVTKALPALMRADKVVKKASKMGNNAGNTEEALKSLKNAVNELETVILHKNEAETEEVFGNILLSCCNLGRFLKKDSEKALTIALNRFIMRFGGN